MTSITSINVGSSANDGTGDPIRTAFQSINANFSALNSGKLEAPDVLFANLPAADASAGKTYFVTDIGNGIYFRSNGTIWRPLNGVACIAASAVPHSVTGGTSETTLATIPIPGNLMTPNGHLRLTSLWTVTSSANAKTMRAKLGGTAFLAGAVTTSATFQNIITIRNRNAANSQVGHPASSGTPISANNSATTTGTVDTTVAQNLLITGQLADAGDTITLEDYLLELMVP